MGGDTTGPRVPASLVQDEVSQVPVLLGLGLQSAADLPSGRACPPGTLTPEHTAVSL